MSISAKDFEGLSALGGPGLEDNGVKLQVLELEAVDGAGPFGERELRCVAHAGSWPQQRAAGEGLRDDPTKLPFHLRTQVKPDGTA